MRMQVTRLFTFLALSGLITYGVEFYSFTLAHSAAGILAVLLCPGILVVVFNLLSGALSWGVAVAINVVYYEMIWRLFRKNRKNEGS